MIEKVAHIKNPLTVIAIFAGIAEVSGTVVLPLLRPEVQATFVWFLMLFPCLLVTAFFGTLLYKAPVLYAPSDYSDEQIFANMLRPATAQQRAEKLEEDAKTANEISAVPLPTQPGEALGTAEDASEEPENSDDGLIQSSNDFEYPDDLLARISLGEDLAISRLSADFGRNFVRNVTLPNFPGFLLDAVTTDAGRTIVVDVIYTQTGSYPLAQLRKVRDKFELLHRGLSSSNSRSEFQFVLILIADAKSDGDRFEKLLSNCSNSMSSWQAPVQAIGYYMNDLIKGIR